MTMLPKPKPYTEDELEMLRDIYRNGHPDYVILRLLATLERRDAVDFDWSIEE